MTKSKSKKAYQENWNKGFDDVPIIEGSIRQYKNVGYYDGLSHGLARHWGGTCYFYARAMNNVKEKFNPFRHHSMLWWEFEQGWTIAFGYDDFDSEEDVKAWAKVSFAASKIEEGYKKAQG